MARTTALQVATLTLIFSACPAFGQENDDYAASIHQEFFSGVKLNPRLQAMGGAFVAHSRGNDALTGNPAGLADLKVAGIEFFGGTYQLGGDDLLYNGVLEDDPTISGSAEGDFWIGDLGIALPVSRYFSLGLGGQDIHSSDEEDEVMAWDHDSDIYYFLLAGSLSDAVSLGYRFGYQDFSRDGSSHHKNPAVDDLLGGPELDRFYDLEWEDGYVHTLGLQWGIHETVRAGLILDYITGKSDVETLLVRQIPDVVNPVGSVQNNFTGETDGWGIRGGVSWDATESTLLALDLGYEDAEWEHDSGILIVFDQDGNELSRESTPGGKETREEWRLGLGVDQEVAEWLFLRAGFQYVWSDYENRFAPRPYTVELDYPVYSGGIGLRAGPCDVHWVLAYTDEAQGHWSSLLGLSLKL
jgi:hypothetical protein